MKHLRKFAILMAMALIVGCGGKPSRMDQRTYDLGCKALEIMDQYNKMEIDEDSAYDQLDEIYKRLKSREFNENESDQEFQNTLIVSDIFCYKVDMTAGKDLFKDADQLRKKLNK